MDFSIDFASLAPIYPELALAVGALALLMFGVFSRREAAPAVSGTAIGLLIAVGLLIVLQPAEGILFAGGFVSDSFGRFMKILVLAGSVFALVLSVSSAADHGLNKFEYPVLVILATLGMMLMV